MVAGDRVLGYARAVMCRPRHILLVAALSLVVVACSDSTSSSSHKRDPVAEFQPTKETLGFDCHPQDLGTSDEYGELYAFDFSLSDRAASFLMSPVVANGSVVPKTLETADTTLDLRGDYRYHNARMADLGHLTDLSGVGTFGQVNFDWPILVPYAPQFADYVQPGGHYRLTVSASLAAPCLYVLEGHGGTTLDLNIYLVGAGGRTAATAPDDPDLAKVLDRVDQIYGQVNVHLGKVRYFDVPKKVRDTYRVVRSQQDVYKLTAYGRPPDDTLDGHLSVDLFLVDDMRFQGSDVLGISAGLPGAAGLHGNPREGLVFQTADLGMDDDYVAHILAHEVGHFLGLRHTTEVVMGTSAEAKVDAMMGASDPIEDTPVCDDIQHTAYDCPDADNLMFPAAPRPGTHVDPQLTAGQGAVFQANPVVKP